MQSNCSVFGGVDQIGCPPKHSIPKIMTKYHKNKFKKLYIKRGDTFRVEKKTLLCLLNIQFLLCIWMNPFLETNIKYYNSYNRYYFKEHIQNSSTPSHLVFGKLKFIFNIWYNIFKHFDKQYCIILV